MQIIRAAARGLVSQESDSGSCGDLLELVENLSVGLMVILRMFPSSPDTAESTHWSVMTCLRWSLHSICLWSSDASSQQDATPPSQSQDEMSIITELKQILILSNDGTKYSGSNTIGKSSKKTKAVSSQSLQSERVRLLCKFKTAILLLQWTFTLPSVSEGVPKENSADGGSDIDVDVGGSGPETTSVSQIPGFQVVAAAFRLWKALLDLGEVGEAAPALLFVEFFEDTYLLFFFLGMYGKVNDQVCQSISVNCIHLL